MMDANNRKHDGAARPAAPPSSFSEQKRRELWIYVAVSLVAVELLIAVGALVFGFITAGGAGFAFPWLTWGALAVIAPTLVLLLVHSADVGLFRSPSGGLQEQEWQKLLPLRLQRCYRILKGAPVVAVLGSLVALGAALLTLEGALTALQRFGEALTPYIPHIVGGLAAVVCVIAIVVAWLNYRTRRLIAEYEFRRVVLEKTGVIIVDKGSTPLPPGGVGDVPYAILSGTDAEGMAQRSLPPGQDDPDEPQHNAAPPPPQE